MNRGSLFFLVITLFIASFGRLSAQSKISGSVKDGNTQLPLSSVTIMIPNSSEGTFTDNKGEFELESRLNFPIEVSISSVGYETQVVEVNKESVLEITLSPSDILGDEVVIAASRVPETIISSPVAIERIDARSLTQLPSANITDVVGRLKGVDMISAGLLFTAPSTRGFASGSTFEVNQFFDGMNGEAPALNFSVGNVAGISEVDLASIELLPGASSALYGSGGINGTIVYTSKDPFQYQGLSAQAKGGVMHINDPAEKASPYQSHDLRYAKVVNNKFAFKITGSYVEAKDWQAYDTRDYDAENLKIKPYGTRESDPAYDGINIYGDETSANMQDVASAVIDAANAGEIPSSMAAPFVLGIQQGLIPNQVVSRTGFAEKDLVDYNTYNTKFAAELAYKIQPDLKLSVLGRYGTGTTLYSGADRFSLKDFRMGQYKVQLDGKHFMLRGYTTQENSGKSYNSGVLGLLINENLKPSPGAGWFAEYVGHFVGAKINGKSDFIAHNQARGIADQGIATPGSALFEKVKDSLMGLPIDKGAAFNDRSASYHVEGIYNFLEQIPFIETQMGLNFRQYVLNSNGTIFDDADGKVKLNTFGGFVQLTKELLDDKLKLTGAVRYDKTDEFEGKWTPRGAIIYSVAPDNNIRVSYQSGYLLPTTQQQHINLVTQRATLIGGLPHFIERYKLDSDDFPAYTLENVTEYGQTFTKEMQQNLLNGMSPVDAQKAAAVSAEDVLTPFQYQKLKPETVQSYEIGYRGLILQKKLMIDTYLYFANYKDFMGQVVLLQGVNPVGPSNPLAGPQLANEGLRKVYQMYGNNEGTVQTWGWAVGADYLLPRNFKLEANISYNRMNKKPLNLLTSFNSPNYRSNVGVSNDDVFRGVGFGLYWRWQNTIRNYTSGGLGVGDIAPFSTLDAQISYKLPKKRLLFKLGGTNIINHYYRTSIASPSIGALYYASIGYNVF